MSLFTNSHAAQMIREGTTSIPSTFTAIDAGAFTFRDIDKITIPPSITDIGHSAFRGCKILTEITIPESIEEIRNNTFENCIRLHEIKLPKSTKRIGERAFLWCESLAKITIPLGVTEIRESTFEGCKNLALVEIPDTVTEIHKSAFKGCKKLQIVSPAGSFAHKFCTRGLFGKIKWVDSGSPTVLSPVIGGEKIQAINRFLQELAVLNPQIQNGGLIESADLISNICRQIMQYVAEAPNAEARIENRVADYYLPTTLKLLEIYVDAKNKTVVANDMEKILADIAPSLSGIAAALKNQLDALYNSKTVDLTADISVLNHVLKMDGVEKNRD